MQKIRLSFATLLLLSASPSFGQYGAAIQACTRDLVTLCSAGQSGASPFVECVKTHFQDFNELCQAAIVRLDSVREACRSDIQQQCQTVKPGAGRTLLCVKQKFAVLSEPCKEAIGHAAEARGASK
jgi:Cysteine rich repeat